MFISVLSVNIDQSFWEAVQWGETLNDVLDNPFYTAGVAMTLEKDDSDNIVEEDHEIIETRTQEAATAIIIEVSDQTVQLISIARNRASQMTIKKLFIK